MSSLRTTIVRSLFFPFVFFLFFSASCGAVKPAPRNALLQKIDAQKASRLIEENAGNADFKIIDVRTPDEYSSGHIAGAVNMDVFSSEDPRGTLDRLDRHTVYLIYCQAGNRSSIVFTVMTEMGFENVYDLFGGIKDWKESGFPLVK